MIVRSLWVTGYGAMNLVRLSGGQLKAHMMMMRHVNDRKQRLEEQAETLGFHDSLNIIRYEALHAKHLAGFRPTHPGKIYKCSHAGSRVRQLGESALSIKPLLPNS